MKFENTWTGNWEGAMRGMRFPMKGVGDSCGQVIGEKDLDLAQRLWKASELDNLAHSKFLRQIIVSVDISAPIYWFKEFDTYKIGTTANSESTMHTLKNRPILISDFECKDMEGYQYPSEADKISKECSSTIFEDFKRIVEKCEELRLLFIETNNMQYWRALIQMLPMSYLQKRHWTANYEVVRNIYNQRKDHRLTEWSADFVDWVRSLPYAEQFLTRKIELETI